MLCQHGHAAAGHVVQYEYACTTSKAVCYSYEYEYLPGTHTYATGTHTRRATTLSWAKPALGLTCCTVQYSYCTVVATPPASS